MTDGAASPYRRIGQAIGADVFTCWRDGEQVILFYWPATLSGVTELVRAIAGSGGFSVKPSGDGRVRAEVLHTEAVDRRMLEITDILVELRHSHPRMVQLRLEMGEEEAKELAGALSNGE